jgi:hypothetical protein
VQTTVLGPAIHLDTLKDMFAVWEKTGYLTGARRRRLARRRDSLALSLHSSCLCLTKDHELMP